jgi:hypothetical protein
MPWNGLEHLGKVWDALEPFSVAAVCDRRLLHKINNPFFEKPFNSFG